MSLWTILPTFIFTSTFNSFKSYFLKSKCSSFIHPSSHRIQILWLLLWTVIWIWVESGVHPSAQRGFFCSSLLSSVCWRLHVFLHQLRWENRELWEHSLLMTKNNNFAHVSLWTTFFPFIFPWCDQKQEGSEKEVLIQSKGVKSC